MDRVLIPIFPHIQSWDAPWLPTFYQKLRDSQADGVLWCKGIDPPEQCPSWATDVRMIGRMYEEDAVSWASMAKGASGASEFFNRNIVKWNARRWVHAWTLGNEPHPPHDVEFLKRLNEYTVALCELMEIEGLLTGTLNLSVGQPDIGLAKYIGDAAEAGTYVILHEYSAPTMWSDASWLCRRSVRTYAEWRAAGFDPRPCLIGETGIDGGVIGQAGKGWREYCILDGVLQEDEYRQQLSDWYGVEIARDPDVLAAFGFTICNWDWRSFNWTEKLAMMVADVGAAGVDIDGNGGPINPPNRSRGVDISQWQNDAGPIDWQEVKDSDIEFVLIRASVGTAIDPHWEENYREATDVGLLVGAYHYLKNVNGQAGIFSQAIAGKELALGPWVDIEDDALTSDKCKSFFQYADPKVGEPINIYTSASKFNRFGKPDWAANRKLWVADWRDREEPELPNAWSEWMFWQQTSNGSVPGIVGRVDLDVYNGKFEDEDTEEDNMIEVIDRVGNVVMTWEQAVADYGVGVVRAEPPDGATVFRLEKLVLDDSPETNWKLIVHDENNAPLPGIACFLGIKPPSGQELPDESAPRLSETVWAQPNGLPNRALVHGENSKNFTDLNGVMQHSLGSGSNYVPPGNGGTHWAWIQPGNQEWFSDVATGFGLWDNHKMFWPIFRQQVQGGNGGNGGTPTGSLEIIVPEIVIPSFKIVVRPIKE